MWLTCFTVFSFCFVLQELKSPKPQVLWWEKTRRLLWNAVKIMVTLLCTGICSSQGRGCNWFILPMVQIKSKRVTFAMDSKLTGQAFQNSIWTFCLWSWTTQVSISVPVVWTQHFKVTCFLYINLSPFSTFPLKGDTLSTGKGCVGQSSTHKPDVTEKGEQE